MLEYDVNFYCEDFASACLFFPKTGKVLKISKSNGTASLLTEEYYNSAFETCMKYNNMIEKFHVYLGKFKLEGVMSPVYVVLSDKTSKCAEYVLCKKGEDYIVPDIFHVDSIKVFKLEVGKKSVNIINTINDKGANFNLFSNDNKCSMNNMNNSRTRNYSAGNFYRPSTQQNKNDPERIVKRVLEEFLWMFNSNGTFYFSQDYDVSHIISKRSNLSSAKPIYKTFDKRFFWNYYMISDIVDIFEAENTFKNLNVSADNMIVPIFRGYVGFFEIMSNYVNRNEHLTFNNGYFVVPCRILLVSKQDISRCGTRMRCRGADSSGNVANFIETEQILISNGGRIIQSFVVLRGSIPYLWSQVDTWKYKPPFVINENDAVNKSAFESHFDTLFKNYGDNIKEMSIVNLINNRGREQKIRDKFVQYMSETQHKKLFFYDFDFHYYCKRNQFQNIRILLNNLEEKIHSFVFNWYDLNAKAEYQMIHHQTGIFRVNCIDCLDRTNVICSAICKRSLKHQFLKIGILAKEVEYGKRIQFTDKFNLLYNEIWANNGDSISRMYAGTDALKSDFTRLGERKVSGLVKDGYKSINRYYAQIFHDAYRQIVMDIALKKSGLTAVQLLNSYKITAGQNEAANYNNSLFDISNEDETADDDKSCDNHLKLNLYMLNTDYCGLEQTNPFQPDYDVYVKETFAKNIPQMLGKTVKDMADIVKFANFRVISPVDELIFLESSMFSCPFLRCVTNKTNILFINTNFPVMGYIHYCDQNVKFSEEYYNTHLSNIIQCDYCSNNENSRIEFELKKIDDFRCSITFKDTLNDSALYMMTKSISKLFAGNKNVNYESELSCSATPKISKESLFFGDITSDARSSPYMCSSPFQPSNLTAPSTVAILKKEEDEGLFSDLLVIFSGSGFKNSPDKSKLYVYNTARTSSCSDQEERPEKGLEPLKIVHSSQSSYNISKQTGAAAKAKSNLNNIGNWIKKGANKIAAEMSSSKIFSNSNQNKPVVSQEPEVKEVPCKNGVSKIYLI